MPKPWQIRRINFGILLLTSEPVHKNAISYPEPYLIEWSVLFRTPGLQLFSVTKLAMKWTFFLLVLALLSTPLCAQHDGARNAVQQIANGNFDQVEKTLAKTKKPFAGQAENHFVRMLKLLAQDEIEQAYSEAKKSVAARLPFERLLLGPKKELAKLQKLEAFQAWMNSQDIHQVVAGPMLGNLTSSSVSIWIRTSTPTTIDVKLVNESQSFAKSSTIRTTDASDGTGVVTFQNLKPNTVYRYEIGQPQITGQFTTRKAEGAASKFKVAFGGGAGFVPEWERMWDTILKENPQAMLMLGDNVYIDQPQFSLCQHYCYYRRQCRPEWKRLIGQVPVYSIWDFATNDCNIGPHIDKPAWKPIVWETFTQNWVNPAYGGGRQQPGCWYDFHIGDVHFIMLDGRYYRHRQGKTMLGPVQKKWALKTLKESKATFKVLVSPVPFTPGIKPGSKDPWDGFPEEREELFAAIEKNEIEGVFLVAADRHRTDLRRIKRPDGYDLYEFMSSKLTNVHTHPVVKTDGLVWGYNKTCSFGLMEFDTTVANPQVNMKCISIDGKVIHEHTLKHSLLKISR